METSPEVKLTQYSHGAGCGCKIAPAVLHNMLSGMQKGPIHPTLLVGNDTKDDAAVVDLGDGTAIISTTDFFMPIVDDPHTFGRIAAANAISDIYAMGQKMLKKCGMKIFFFEKFLEKLINFSEIYFGHAGTT